MTTFALVFMWVSIASVTTLAVYCLVRTTKADPPVEAPPTSPPGN